MKVTVVCEFDKAKALEAALAAVGADEFAFMREVLQTVDNQCTNNEEADDILEDLRAVFEGYFQFSTQTREDYVCMIRKLYKCPEALHYATLMTFGHYEKPHDVEQIICGEFVNLRNGDEGAEIKDESRMDDTFRIFGLIGHGMNFVVREVLCNYVIELQKQTTKI